MNFHVNPHEGITLVGVEEESHKSRVHTLRNAEVGDPPCSSEPEPVIKVGGSLNASIQNGPFTNRRIIFGHINYICSFQMSTGLCSEIP